MSSNVFKWVQNLFKCVKCVPACPKLVQMCSNVFKIVQKLSAFPVQGLRHDKQSLIQFFNKYISLPIGQCSEENIQFWDCSCLSLPHFCSHYFHQIIVFGQSYKGVILNCYIKWVNNSILVEYWLFAAGHFSCLL